MAEDEPQQFSPAVTQAARTNADLVCATLAIKIIIADLAVKDRTPEEAQKYILRFRGQMEEFVSKVTRDGTDLNALFIKDMEYFIERLFGGIQFDRDKP